MEHHVNHTNNIAVDPINDNNTSLFSLIAQRRGWDVNSLRDLNTSRAKATNALLDGIDDVAAYIHQCIDLGVQFTVLTDFDVDGISSGMVMYAGLAEMGADINIVVPDYHGSRNIEPSDIDHALRLYPDTGVFITCDEGTNSTEGIRYAQSLGRRFIVTDHHLELEPCAADFLLNPNRIGSAYPEPDICGAQVAHHLLTRYTTLYRPDKTVSTALLAVFAGIGALADVMPLVGQTRTLVDEAVTMLQLAVPTVTIGRWNRPDTRRMSSVLPNTSQLMVAVENSTGEHDYRYSRAFYGLSLLMREFMIAKKINGPQDIDTGFLGFTFAPTFNATRRVEGDMHDSFVIFAPQAVKTSDPSYRKSQSVAAATIIANNEHRKELTVVHTNDLLTGFADNTQPYAPYVWLSDGAPGILGLLASRMSEQFAVPVAVLRKNADGTYSGSGRAPDRAAVLTPVNHARDTAGAAIRAAGHDQACGVFADDDAALVALYTALRTEDQTTAPDPTADTRARAALTVSDILSVPGSLSRVADPVAARHAVDDIDMLMPTDGEWFSLISMLDLVGPFGHGFEYPDISILADTDNCTFSIMGRNDQHVKIITATGFTLLWWNAATRLKDIQSSSLFAAHIEVSVNTFGGISSPQGIVRDLTPY